MEKVKVVAYFVNALNEDIFTFYQEIISHCHRHNFDLVAIFHDKDKSEKDYLSAWDNLISFLLINKEIKQVLLPYTNNRINFDGYERISYMQEFIDLPCATSWRIIKDEGEHEDYEWGIDYTRWETFDSELRNNGVKDKGITLNVPYLDISEDDIPF
ncbi:hypothetical protein [Heyndrickxia ginsengihumi]|uniref:hypothetical protein n=1 Tax=Heyndrickxia ginsengihumi TaxID=363870 RepID=UPI00203D413C|nr:hypothetical protein [Heyndrickxia ginsengihumi]MCM3024126.1 hypothetical protein [Heyndrickxia ginsengihumi]